ncbi:MAG: MliC family protein [Candidatus Gribaldobacteria bacterium]|nr:MliC family protein [Candidatus Gribaldobacteria bacterium]
MKKIYIASLVIVLLVVGVVFTLILFQKKPSSEITNTLISQVDYQCDTGKTINAKYYEGAKAKEPQPEEMPTPTGSVELVLSDGQHLTLSQTISGSGIRYATANESLIFWSKGNSAFITENDVQTYSGCVALAKDPGGLPQAYASSTAGFSVRYPANYIVDPAYHYQGLGPNKKIEGVKFIIPTETATGTNLSSFDTGVSVETFPNISNCNAGLFLDSTNNGTSTIIENDTPYSVATSSGAGAGNFYEETVWAIPNTNPCIAVRYFIHSTNLGNYTPGTIQEFNRQTLMNQFDVIRRTLILAPSNAN